MGPVGMALHQWASACPEQQWVYNPRRTSFSQAGACVGGVFYYLDIFKEDWQNILPFHFVQCFLMTTSGFYILGKNFTEMLLCPFVYINQEKHRFSVSHYW